MLECSDVRRAPLQGGLHVCVRKTRRIGAIQRLDTIFVTIQLLDCRRLLACRSRVVSRCGALAARHSEQ